MKRFEQFYPESIDPKNFTEEQFESFVSWLRDNEKPGDNAIATKIATLRNFLKDENPKRAYHFIKTRQIYDNVIYINSMNCKQLEMQN